MKKFLLLFCLIMYTTLTRDLWAQVKSLSIVEEPVTYSAAGVSMKGYITYNKEQKGKRPGILVVHEWWGCNDYARKRARMLAQLGYVAFAMDMYGDGKLAADPATAKELATPFYQDPGMAKERIEAALQTLKSYDITNDDRIAGIGYCFGGGMLLNAAKMGLDVDAVVSFHGSLAGVPAKPGTTVARILVCHGTADKSVPASDIKQFKRNLDSVHVPYTFINYTNATHAFTNPDATALGKKFKMPIRYDTAADKKSWKDMQVFLKNVFMRT